MNPDPADQLHRMPKALRRAVTVLLPESSYSGGQHNRGRPPHTVVLSGPQGAGRSTVLTAAFHLHTGPVDIALADFAGGDTSFSYLRQLLPHSSISAGSDIQTSEELGDALVRFWHETDQTGPRLVLLDNVERADQESLRALSRAARLARGTAVTLVFGITDDADRQLSAEVSSFLRNPLHHRIELGTLEPLEILDLAQHLRIRDFDHYSAVALWHHTEGWLGDTVGVLQSLPGGKWPRNPRQLPVPPAVRVQALAAFDRLPSTARTLAQTYAVAGSHFDLPTIGRIAGIDNPLEALEALDQCVAVGLLKENTHGTQRTVSFGHPLARLTVRETALPSVLRSLAKRASESAVDPERRLLLQARAEMGANPPVAGKLADIAEQAGRDGRWNESAEFHIAAAGLCAETDARNRMLLAGVDALVSAGRLDRSALWLPEIEALPASADRDMVLAHISMHHGMAAETEELLNRAERSAEPPAGGSARLAARKALDSIMRWDISSAQRWAQQTLILSEPEDPKHTEAETIGALALTAQGKAPDLSSLARSQDIGDVPAQSQRFHLYSGWIRIMTGDLEAAVGELQAAVPVQYQDGSLRVSLWAQGWLARTQYLLGQWDNALQRAESALVEARRSSMAIVVPMLQWTVEEICSLQGSSRAEADGWRTAGTADALHSYTAMQVPARLTRALRSRARRNPEGSAAALIPLQETDPWTAENISFWPWQPELVDALIAIGQVEDARRISRDFLDRTAASPVHVRSAALIAAARVAAVTSETASAETHLAEAVELTSGTTYQTASAQARLALGQFLRRAGRRRTAAQNIEQALEFYESVEATRMVRYCSQELRATGLNSFRTGDRGMGAAEAKASAAALTPQEQAVSDLVARGLTNPETAQQLYLSEKTVQYHLTRIYAKLGIRSRTELATVYPG